ncbi:MAG TPA: MarR family transcriptional regulator [Solirubrobacterales bacterium]|nr:MarR family transcriptional regulator [Solirubrobacterales bacterium]
METTQPTVVEIASRLRFAIVRTARRLRQEANAAEGKGLLSPTLTAALGTINAHGPLTPSELADRERVRRPTATRIVSSLGELGLVSRTPDPSDGRASLVATTAEGRALLIRLRKRKNAYLARRMRNLDADEVATLERAAEILERMLDDGRVAR